MVVYSSIHYNTIIRCSISGTSSDVDWTCLTCYGFAVVLSTWTHFVLYAQLFEKIIQLK